MFKGNIILSSIYFLLFGMIKFRLDEENWLLSVVFKGEWIE